MASRKASRATTGQPGRQGGAGAARLRAGHAAASPPGKRKKTVLPLVGRAGFARLGCYSGGLAGLPGKSFSLPLNSVFLFFCKFVALLKIVRHLQKS